MLRLLTPRKSEAPRSKALAESSQEGPLEGVFTGTCPCGVIPLGTSPEPCSVAVRASGVLKPLGEAEPRP